MKTLEEATRGKKYSELLKLYRSIKDGKVAITDPSPPRDFFTYLVRPEYSNWLWAGIVLALLTILAIALSDHFSLVQYLRYILGSIFVLFLPGYYTVEALYPKEEDLSGLERLALSIGLSIALVPLIGLVLNYTPWGIRLWPVIESLTLYTIVISFTAAYRKYLLVRKRLIS